ncbi:hypothetical protein B0H12DRAFT_1228967 [Mycena haematopus]|nr:hypothetical protein B0H12DRAFT_1228967 [Mycena haematopus]
MASTLPQVASAAKALIQYSKTRQESDKAWSVVETKLDGAYKQIEGLTAQLEWSTSENGRLTRENRRLARELQAEKSSRKEAEATLGLNQAELETCRAKIKSYLENIEGIKEGIQRAGKDTTGHERPPLKAEDSDSTAQFPCDPRPLDKRVIRVARPSPTKKSDPKSTTSVRIVCPSIISLIPIIIVWYSVRQEPLCALVPIPYVARLEMGEAEGAESVSGGVQQQRAAKITS